MFVGVGVITRVVVVVSGVFVVVTLEDIVTELAINVTSVCDRALPFSLAPVFIEISVLDKIIPLKSDVVPRVVLPATCQKMFFDCAPPLKVNNSTVVHSEILPYLEYPDIICVTR